MWSLQPANRLVLEIELATGWRVDDILELKTEQVENALKKKRPCISIIEKKTKKTSKKYFTRQQCERMLEQAGKIYVFQSRDDYRRHRSRQAVYMDLKRAAKRFNLKLNLAPHSLRKNYAVYLKLQGKSLEEIQRALNHDSITTTLLYAMSDELTQKYK